LLYLTDKDYEYVGREKYRQIDEKGTGMMETRWRRKDGEIIHIILSSTPLDTRDLSKGVTFTALDITERKQAEDEIKRRVKELEEFYDMAVGRELRMVALHKEIEQLKQQLGKFEIKPQ
jgi:hypothetical protein